MDTKRACRFLHLEHVTWMACSRLATWNFKVTSSLSTGPKELAMVDWIPATVSSLITRRRVAQVSRQQPWLISYSGLDGGSTLVEEGESDRLSSLYTAACPVRIILILVWPCGQLFVPLVALRQVRRGDPGILHTK